MTTGYRRRRALKKLQGPLGLVAASVLVGIAVVLIWALGGG